MRLLGNYNGHFSTGLLGLALSLAACSTAKSPLAANANPGSGPTSMMLLGCSHLAQLYKADNPNSDVLTPKRQAELAAVINHLARYQPDGILVEALPEQQGRIDSLYQRYRQGQLDLNTLPGGRSELYQLGFVLGKRLGLARIYCVNAPGGTSQSILSAGKNIELYEQATANWRTFSDPIGQ